VLANTKKNHPNGGIPMAFNLNIFTEEVEELINNKELDALVSMAEAVSKAKKAIVSNRKNEQKRKLNDLKIQERFAKMNEGYILTKAKSRGSEITVQFRNERLTGNYISSSQNGVSITVNGERKIVAFHQIVG